MPFCSLYKVGYTSLGALSNTLPNPALKEENGDYRPAWELKDASKERDGRSTTTSTTTVTTTSTATAATTAATATTATTGTVTSNSATNSTVSSK